MPDSILGISVSDRGVQAVEVMRNGLTATLLAIDEWENPFAGGGLNGDQEHFRVFAEAVRKFLDDNRISAKRVSLALDTSFLFLHNVPVDDGASQEEIREQVRWELEQFFPGEPPEEFVTDFHRMRKAPGETAGQILSVSLRRAGAQTLSRLLKELGLRIQILDADHFSAETALRVNYPDIFRRMLALVGVKENRLDISILRNGNLEGYSYRVVNSNQEIIDAFAALSRQTQGIFSITAYGPYLDTDLLHRIRRASALLVEALNPLRHVSVADSLRLADHLTAPSYRFASAVGVALRRE
jgi:Tfp pilus assembly PilM family ATPase